MIDTKDDVVVKADDLKSIEELCIDTWEPLYRYVYFKVQNKEEAEDITQETYIKAIKYIRKSNVKIDKFIGFLKAVSLNVLRDRWRSGKRHEKSLSFDDIKLEAASVQDYAEDIAQREVVERALSILNEEQRTVIELRILKGYSVGETARQMNKQEGNIRVMQYRALKRLTEILKGEY